MALSRKFLTVGALGVASFALIGAGATASFNDSVTAEQQITAGALGVTIGSNAAGAVVSDGGKTLTLADVGPVRSTFATPVQTVTVTNSGNLAAKLVGLQVTAPGNTTLVNGLKIRIAEVGSSSSIYDGYITGLQRFASDGIGSTPDVNKMLGASGGHWSADVMFYADNLTNPAMGGTVTPTLKVLFED